MATSSNKVSLLPEHTTPASEDLLMVVDDPNGTPTSKKIKLQTLFGILGSNVNISGTVNISGDLVSASNNWNVTAPHVNYSFLNVNKLTISSNGFIISNKFTPSNSSISESGSQGKILYDDNYLYIKTANNVVKRVALSSF